MSTYLSRPVNNAESQTLRDQHEAALESSERKAAMRERFGEPTEEQIALAMAKHDALSAFRERRSIDLMDDLRWFIDRVFRAGFDAGMQHQREKSS